MAIEKRTLETRPLAALKSHPLQDRFFDPLDDAALAALADDLRRNGLREPLEVLPDGVILSGHQRRRALERLGRTEARVLVRYDLAGDPAAAERRFLEANQHRRQRGRLAQARVALRLYEIERKRPRGRLRPDEQPEARDRVGAAIGMTGRNLSRYMRVLAAPPEVQKSFESGAVRLVDAEKAADLPRAEQAELARAIREGGDANALVRAAVGAARTRSDAGDPWEPLKKLVTWAERAEAASDKVPPHMLARHFETLGRAAETLARLAEQGREKAASRAATA